MLHVVPDRLPNELRAQAVRHMERAFALPPVKPGLVHGDLAGTNVLWCADGTFSGVLD